MDGLIGLILLMIAAGGIYLYTQEQRGESPLVLFVAWVKKILRLQ